MSFDDLKFILDEEVGTILSSEFVVDVVETRTVPHSGDGAITFPNFDTWTQGAKLIDTAVLYIDIRNSTDLNLTHKPQTVAKLYSAFIRAMTHVAQYHEGHVRGIIGDRLMVLFDSAGAVVNAIECAFSMNTVGRYVIDKNFRANDVTFGIGIDCGKMLATKTGIRRHGHEQSNYRNLVWLGRPANIASKLTDLANKPAENVSVPAVSVAYRQTYSQGLLAAAAPVMNYLSATSPLAQASSIPNWNWRTETPQKFIADLEVNYGATIRHKNPDFVHFVSTTQNIQIRPKTPPILMTAAVWNAYRAAKPKAACVTEKYMKAVSITVPNYTGAVFGGDVIHPALKD